MTESFPIAESKPH